MKSEKERFMALALKEADKAEKKEEVPIGCVIVKDGKVVARAHNLKQTKRLATAHAEVLAIEKVCRKLKDWRLEDYEIYVTLEGGGVESKFRILTESGLNHVTEYEGGVLEKECSEKIKTFFKTRRK